MDCRTLSVEKLIRLSISYGLIEDYRMTPTRIRLFTGGQEMISCDPEEARFYLQGLIMGGTVKGRSLREARAPIRPPGSGEPRAEE